MKGEEEVRIKKTLEIIESWGDIDFTGAVGSKWKGRIYHKECGQRYSVICGCVYLRVYTENPAASKFKPRWKEHEPICCGTIKEMWSRVFLKFEPTEVYNSSVLHTEVA